MEVLTFLGRAVELLDSFGWNTFVVATILVVVWLITGPAASFSLRLVWACMITIPSGLFTWLAIVTGADQPFAFAELTAIFAVYCGVIILKNHTFIAAAVGVIVSIIVALSNPNVGQDARSGLPRRRLTTARSSVSSTA